MTSTQSIEITKIDFLHDQIKINIKDESNNLSKKSLENNEKNKSIENNDIKIDKNKEKNSLENNITNPGKIDPIFTLVKDITFNLILNVAGLRKKLDNILNDPNLTIIEISKVFNEVQSRIPPTEMDKIRLYFSNENTRNNLSGILQNSFTKIMEDGKIDMNDATHFMSLIYDVVTLFNDHTTDNDNQMNISSDSIMIFLYFIIKSILVLTLDDMEERIAVGLLDTSFKLISIAVLPIMKLNCSCNPFKCFKRKNKK